MWEEEKHPRDEQGRFTSKAKEFEGMSADELKAYILSNSIGEKNITAEKSSVLSINLNNGLILSRYVNSSEKLYQYAKNIKPIDSFEDQVIHGDKYGFEINDLEGLAAAEYSAKEFADILKSDPNYHGGNIRLISCNTGADEGIVAQTLADCLGVDVLAPNDVVIVYPDGTMKVGIDGNGKWILFKKR